MRSILKDSCQSMPARLIPNDLDQHALAPTGARRDLRLGVCSPAKLFKNNVWPMQRISESLPSIKGNSSEEPSALKMQARLLGISGLLPVHAGDERPAAQAYLRKIWDLWWREREEHMVIPLSLWRLGGLRPANHPQRRLALA